MSGHSKWSTIKRAKEANDKAKGKVFSKLSRAISIAAKTGGGGDPDSNYKLRVAIDAARALNMPKDNIERAILKASGEAANLEEVAYEGFGPSGVGVIVEAATDNRNRTGQEIKNMLEKSGGSLGGPGSVSFNFENKGLLVVKKSQDVESQILSFIDLGADDVEETPDGIEVYTQPAALQDIKNKLEEAGFAVEKAELTRKPVNIIDVSDPNQARRVLNLLESLEDHDDVQKVYANVNIPDDVVNSLD